MPGLQITVLEQASTAEGSQKEKVAVTLPLGSIVLLATAHA